MNHYSKNLKVAACLLVMACLPRLASALIVGPYVPADANTTFLFHFDDSSSGSVAANAGTVGGSAYTVKVGIGGGTSIAATNVVNLLGGAAYSTSFTNAITFPATNTGYLVGFGGSSGSFTTDTGNGGTRSPNAIAESSLGIGASATAPWTIEALIKPFVTNAAQEIVCMDSYASSRGFQFKITVGGQLQFQTIGGTAYSQVVGIPSSGANAFVPGSWYHVAVTYNGSVMQLYWTAMGSGVTAAAPLGSAATPTSGSMGTTQGAVTGPLIIGNKDRLPAVETFNGSIDEVRISNVARSAGQMMFAPATISITQQPIGQEGVDYGGTGTFNVSASSALPISYQWLLNGVPITGATNTTYTFTNATLASGGNYSCAMTNSNPYSITSSVTTVVIGAANFLTNRYSFLGNPNDSISGQNGTNVGGVTYNSGGTVTLDGSSGYIQLPSNIINTNAGAVTIETWCNFGTIAVNTMLFAFGNTNGTLGTNYIFATGHGSTARMAITAGTYTGEQGAVTGAALDNSNDVQVVCVFAADLNTEVFYVNGVQAAINTNATLPLSSVVDNYSLIGHSLFSGDPYLAGTINEFRIYQGAMSAASVQQSYLQGYSNILSDGAVAILFSPTNVSTAQGLPVTFSTVASGHQTILYQWLKNGSRIVGATNASYTYSPTFADNNATFQVLATNTVGGTNYSAASGTATLTVSVPATYTWFNDLQDNVWSLTSPDWNSTFNYYAQYDGVIFNDSDYYNSTPGPTINLTIAATPIAMTVSNTAENYLLTSSSGGSLGLLGTLLKQGPGTFTLDVTNNSTTPVVVQNGTLQVGNGDTVGSLGSGPVTNNATLVFDRTDSIGVPNDLHGTGSIVLNSGGITPTSTNSDYSGSTVINAGFLYATTTNALGSTAGGTTVNSGGQLYITGNVNFGAEALSLAGSGDGNGALRKGGAGVTTYGGALTMTANSTIGVDSGATLTLPGSITDLGSGYALTAVGGGTLALNSANPYSGGFTLNGPIVTLGTNGTLGTGQVTVGGTGRFVLADLLNLTNSIVANTVSPGAATGMLMVNDNTNGNVTTISGPITFNANAANGGHFVGPTSSGYLNITGPVTLSGSATAIVIRFGNLRFSGGGSYGEIQVRANTTSLGADNGISTNALLDTAGNGAAYFDLNGHNQMLGGLKNTVTPANAALGFITNSSASAKTLTLALGAGNTYPYGGSVGGNLSLVLNSGQEDFTGTNTYSGNTTINGGTLELGVASIATNSTVNIASGGILQMDFSTTNQVSALVLGGVSQAPGVYNSTTSGSFIAGSGSLLVVVPGPSGPAHLTNSISGKTLTFTWPSGQSWRLVSQTNSLSAGLTSGGWNTVPGGIDGSNSVTIDPTKPAVFYRLTYP